MIRKRLLVTGLAMSMCLNQMPPTVLVRASQNTNSNSKFEVEVKNSKASKYGYIKPTGQSYATNPKSKLKKAAQLPAHYGSMEKDVRDQNPFGTCWAFAGTGSFEYAVDKKTGSNTDYSEEHMIQRLSKNGDTEYQITSKDTGGNEYMYSGYFTSGYGPVSDSLFPYDTTKSTLQIIPSILNAKGNYRATDVQFFKTTDDANGALNSETVNTVKQAVYNNGSATCGITWDSSMIQKDKVSYYNNDDNARNDSNHEVLIVGWDDDYSADHFDGVAKNGAWLVRNSWGNNIGDNGYFWVSYQDKSLIPSCTIKSYEEVSDDDTIYNLDESGALYPQVTYDGTSQVGFINSFSLKKREKLKEVTFYEAETGAQYQLFYIPVKDDGSLDIGNKQAITEKKTLDFPGYHTEKITKEINVKKAAIMVMIDSNEDSAGLGAEGSISDGRKKLYIPTLEKGQSYIYANGELGDLYDMGTNFGNWSIKLVTEKADSAFYAKDHKNSTDLGSFQWTGSSVKPSIGDIVSEDDGSVLKQGTDYELEYENNTNPGTATVKITGLGKYAKCSLTFTYTIENKTFHIEGKKDGDSLDDKDWTGEEINPSVGNVLSDYDNRVLEEGTDYKLVYSDNINVGTATVKVIGMGDYEGCNLTFIYKIAESCGYNGFYVENASDKSDLGSVKWTGDPIRKKPGAIRCSHCKKELTEGTDYELEYKNNIDPGTATVTVKGIGKYKGYEQSFTYTIEHRTFHLNHHQNHDNIGTVKWTGKEVNYLPENIVSDHNETVLEKEKDYKVEYTDNIEPGTASIKIIGINDYKGCELKFTYTIEPDCGYGGFYAEMHQNGTDLGKFDWTGSDVQPYLGKILCKHCNKELEVGNDYIIQYSNNIDPGKATMKVTGIGKYKGYEQSFTYTIGHKTFTVGNHKNGDSLGKVKWTGKELKYDIGAVVDASGKRLEENKDYTVAYSNNVKLGTATVKVTGLGEYKDNSYDFTFEILEDCGYGGFYVEDLDDGASLGSYKWTGEAIEKRLTQILCKHCDRELLEGTDYTIEYSDNVEPGTATVKIIGLNQFKGYDKTYHYTIEHKTFHNSRFEDGEDLGTVEWTGKETTIDLERILSDHQDELLVEGKDYEVTYSDNIKPGTAKVTITGLGDYKGCELNFTYKIHKTIQSTTTESKPETIPSVPNTPSTTAPETATSTTAKRPGTKKITVKKAAIQKIKALKKSFTINILKNKDQVTGYQISYSYKKNFKGQKVKALKKFKYKKIRVKRKKHTITSYKVKGLKKKKTVYVRVRAYKQVGKTKVYGKWSRVKKVKIK
jgi:C1A family cysteine protease